MDIDNRISGKPRVLMITRYFPEDYKGGGEYVIYNIWKNASLYFDVKLISGWVNDPKLLPPGTYTVDLRSKNTFIRYLKLYFAVKKHVKKIKPDLVHTNTIEIPKLNVPTIAMSHHLGHLLGKTNESFIIRLKLRFQKALAKIRYNRFDKITAVSESTKNDLIELGVDPNKIEVIYNGIEVEKFKPDNKKTKFEKRKFIILHLSRISKEKGQHVAIKSLSYLPKEIREKVMLYIVGYISDKKYYSELKKLSEGLPVKLIGDVPDIVEYYQKCDILVFPTLMTEGFGLVSAEALCCEKPVIASDYPAIREVVRDNGILVPPNDVNELANAIVRLYENPKLRTKFGKNGRKFVLNNFTWDIAFEKYKKVYDNILS